MNSKMWLTTEVNAALERLHTVHHADSYCTVSPNCH